MSGAIDWEPDPKWVLPEESNGHKTDTPVKLVSKRATDAEDKATAPSCSGAGRCPTCSTSRPTSSGSSRVYCHSRPTAR